MRKRILTSIFALSLLTASPVHAKQDSRHSCPQWESLIAEYGLPVKWTSAVMYRESRCIEGIVSKPNSNGTVDVSLMQINSSWRSVTKAVCKTNKPLIALKKARCNLAVAKYLFDHGGKSHWRTSSGSK